MASEKEITIHLTDLRFFAYHGLYEHEKKNGNEFEMNLSLSFQNPDTVISHIKDTVNYADVYDIITMEMQKPRELLETFLEELFLAIKNRYPIITKLNATLYKLTAPIKGLEGKVGVELTISYV
ncbi:MAG: dihydroneopterin aldolase [Niabella sp.]